MRPIGQVRVREKYNDSSVVHSDVSITNILSLIATMLIIL